MKPLYELNNEMKETKFDSFVFDILEEIDKLTDKWFDESFINKLDYIPNEVLDHNLCSNLNYLFTEAIWLIELGKSLGYSMDSEQFVQTNYDTYTTNGFKHLVNDKRYDRVNNKVFTKKEVKEREKRSNELMKKIFDDLDL